MIVASRSTIIWGVLGDQPGTSTATAFTYTITGLTFNGTPMRAKGLFYPLLWSNTTTLAGSGTMSISPVPGGSWVLRAAMLHSRPPCSLAVRLSSGKGRRPTVCSRCPLQSSSSCPASRTIYLALAAAVSTAPQPT